MPAPIRSWKPPRPRRRSIHADHYNSGEWAIRRKAVLVRDSYRCQACGIVCVERAQIDHVIALEDGGSDDMANLQTLCLHCHGIKSRREQRARGMD
jgi:5-methylcytosine-specific restriction endonuclease McrA